MRANCRAAPWPAITSSCACARCAASAPPWKIPAGADRRPRRVPNYFGEQRFGHDGGNVACGQVAMFAGKRVDRAKRGFLISAGQVESVQQPSSPSGFCGRHMGPLPWTAKCSCWTAATACSDPEPLDERLQHASEPPWTSIPRDPMWGRGELRPHKPMCIGTGERRVLAEQEAAQARPGSGRPAPGTPRPAVAGAAVALAVAERLAGFSVARLANYASSCPRVPTRRWCCTRLGEVSEG
jgi:hypothetical protein